MSDRASSPASKRHFNEIVPSAIASAIISLPVAHFASGDHSFLQALIVLFITLWFLIGAGVYFAYFISRVRRTIRNANEGINDHSGGDLTTIRTWEQAYSLMLVIFGVIFISFFPAGIFGIPANIAIFVLVIALAVFLYRRGRNRLESGNREKSLP